MVFSLVACLAAVASCGSFLIASGAFTCSRGSYFQRLSTALKNLKDKMELLDRLCEKIKKTQRTPQQEDRNAFWFEKVKTLKTNAEEKKKEASAEIKSRCIRFFCPRHCCSFQGLDAELSDVSEELKELTKEGETLDKEQQDMLISAKEMENKPMISLPSVLDQIQTYVTKPSVQITGVCDPRDSGRLSKQIHRKLAENFLVISVNMWNPESRRVQEDIGGKLGLSDDFSKTESQDERALLIRNYLVTKKFVLLLDGLSEKWEPSDLSRIGVPLENRESKIVITAPRRSVIELMKVDVCVEAGILTEHVLSRLTSSKENKAFTEPQPPDTATPVGLRGVVAFTLLRTLAEPSPDDMARLFTLADGPITIWTTSVNWVIPNSRGLTENFSKKRPNFG